MAKTPYEIYEIEEYRKGEKEQLIDGQIFETRKEFNNKTTRQTKERRVVYQCKQKRAELDLRDIDKQICNVANYVKEMLIVNI